MPFHLSYARYRKIQASEVQSWFHDSNQERSPAGDLQGRHLVWGVLGHASRHMVCCYFVIRAMRRAGVDPILNGDVILSGGCLDTKIDLEDT
jgi:hypothetical protein